MPAVARDVITTYFPSKETGDAQILDILGALKGRNPDAPERSPHLVDSAGVRHDLPEALVQPLLVIAEALNQGKAVSVAPHHQMLTTQDAADFLGVSRPTLVKLLEDGEIPFTKLKRHRRVKLSDVVAYQAQVREETQESLRALSRTEYADGTAEATVGIPPAMR